jgi:hypothetical protein
LRNRVDHVPVSTFTCTDNGSAGNGRGENNTMSSMVMDLAGSYLNFATDNGNRHDVGTAVMVAGPVLIALLAVYFVYNLTAAVVNAVRFVGGFAARLVRPARTATVAALVPVVESDTATVYLVASAA